MMPATLVAILLSLLGIVSSTAFHYEALRMAGGFARRSRRPRLAVPAVLAFVIAAHFVEILFYMLIYSAARGPFALGHFSGAQPGALGLFYYAAETYSSLGAGDIFPHGELRVIASASSLNGILLLAWSGAFLYAITDRLGLIE